MFKFLVASLCLADTFLFEHVPTHTTLNLCNILIKSTSYCTFGLVSTMYNCFAFGLDFRIALIICSSSTERAFNPDKGWLERQMAA